MASAPNAAGSATYTYTYTDIGRTTFASYLTPCVVAPGVQRLGEVGAQRMRLRSREPKNSDATPLNMRDLITQGHVDRINPRSDLTCCGVILKDFVTEPVCLSC